MVLITIFALNRSSSDFFHHSVQKNWTSLRREIKPENVLFRSKHVVLRIEYTLTKHTNYRHVSKGLERPWGFQKDEALRIYRQSAHEGGKDDNRPPLATRKYY